MQQHSIRRSQRENTRARVREAAALLFLRNGLAATSVRQIAHKAGVSVGTVLAEGDKDALFLEIIEERLTQSALGSVDPERPLPDVLRALIDRSMYYCAEHPELTADYLGVLLRSKMTGTNMSRLRSVFDALGVLFAHHLQTDQDDPAVSRMVFSLYTTLVGTIFAVATGALSVEQAHGLFSDWLDDRVNALGLPD